jgi:rare lipoprotein A
MLLKSEIKLKYINKFLKYSLSTSFVISTILFTGCADKPKVQPSDINRIYKPNVNKQINNSKAMHRATLRPYTVFGIKYYPFIANIHDEFTGIASWYGPNFHAKKTSNGEIYNMYSMTAAHKTLPMNTVLRVDNLENGKSIIVRINDRGPFVDGRIIDLSNVAARKIDMVRKGTVRVKITVLGYNGQIKNYDAPTPGVYSEKVIPKKVVQKQSTYISPMTPVAIEQKVISRGRNYSIQVGAFSKFDGANRTKNKYQNMLNNKYQVVINKVFSNDRELYKVLIKGFKSYDQAEMFKDLNSLDRALIIKK